MPRSASPSKTKPSPIVGKKKIEEFVAKRPNKEELLDKNILKSGAVAPGLASKQSELEKSKVKDTINSHLTARPTTDHLVEQNVLMVDPTSKTAPTGQILQAQQALKKSQVSDSLTKKLDARKSETDLLTRNILKGMYYYFPWLVSTHSDLFQRPPPSLVLWLMLSSLFNAPRLRTL
eukprot:Partr_v1_DN27961_c1_g1_i1_m11684 putative RPEL repeat protein